MIKVILRILFTVLCSHLALSQDLNIHSDKSLGFEIKYPVSWDVLEMSNIAFVAKEKERYDNKFHDNFNLITQVSHPIFNRVRDKKNSMKTKVIPWFCCIFRLPQHKYKTC